jgi:putative hydrolases of HD superfamily
MLLIHDIVEIDAADVPMHGEYGTSAIKVRETEAAKRPFGMLPSDQVERLLTLRQEFEAAETPEATFAKALDRLQSLLLDTLTGGGTWSEGNVSEQEVYERYGPTIWRGSPALWAYARTLVRQHFTTFRLQDPTPH